MDVRHNNNALQELNDCIRGLLHLGLHVITFTTLLHLGPNVITFRTSLHLGQLLHLGLQQTSLFSPMKFSSNVLKTLSSLGLHAEKKEQLRYFKTDYSLANLRTVL